MLKILRSGNSRVVFTLSGQMEAEDVKELRRPLPWRQRAAVSENVATRRRVILGGDLTVTVEVVTDFNIRRTRGHTNLQRQA